MIVIDLSAIMKAKSEQTNCGVAEDALDKHFSKRMKLDITFILVTDILGINLLLATFTNSIMLLLYYWTFKVEGLSL